MQQSRYKMSMPTCPICSKPYDMYYHIPRVLPKCGHTFCQKCIKSKLANKKGRLSFTCNQCQSDIIIRKNVSDQLPKNITIVDLIKDIKYKVVEQQQKIGQSNNICSLHNKKLQMICLTCNNIKICSHCAIFGQHKSHNIGNQENATKQDMKEIQEFINIIQDTVNQMLLPNSPANLEKQSKNKLTSTLQLYIKQNFKAYYQQIARRQAQLLQQCQSIIIDQKAGQYLDSILISFDLLKIKGKDVKIMNRSEVQAIIQSAKDLHNEIQRIVQSFNKSIDTFLEQSKSKIRDIIFFDVQLIEKRNIKTILRGNMSPQGKTNTKNIQNKKEDMIVKKSNIKQTLQRKNTDNFSSNVTQRPQKTQKSKSFLQNNNNPPIPSSSQSVRGQTSKSKIIVLNDNRKQEPTNQTKKASQSQIISNNQIEQQNQNIANPKLNKNSSIKRTQLTVKTPQKHKSRQKSPAIDYEAQLKFHKPTKQLNYQLRPKFQSIINQIDRQPSQGSLQLIGQQITDPLIPYICEYLKTKKIQYSMIKLVKNNITDQGCRIFLAYLSTDNFTKVLNLTGNQLTYRTLSSISNFITHNNICKTIYLSHNKINNMQLKKIQKLLDNKFVQVII